MSVRRATDTEDVSVFRSERYFTSDGQWFFATREAGDQGPFGRREDASEALTQYLINSIGLKELDAWNTPGATH